MCICIRVYLCMCMHVHTPQCMYGSKRTYYTYRVYYKLTISKLIGVERSFHPVGPGVETEVLRLGSKSLLSTEPYGLHALHFSYCGRVRTQLSGCSALN